MAFSLRKFSIKKFYRKTYIKLIKQSGTPDSIARGVAIGFFIGFLIPIGFQTFIALALAFITKAKKIPAMACTWITNPWTVIFIYPVQCYIGAKVIGNSMSLDQIKSLLQHFMEHRTWDNFTNLGSDIMVPFIVGGALFGIIAGAISYFASYGMIISYRSRSDARLRKKLAIQAVWKDTLDDRRGVEKKKSD